MCCHIQNNNQIDTINSEKNGKGNFLEMATRISIVRNTVLDVEALRAHGFIEQADIDTMLAVATIAFDAKNNEAIGRYQGWGLVRDDVLGPWLEKNMQRARAFVEILRWESLSYDLDDHGDFAVKVKQAPGTTLI
jgi:hypothetical protein